MRTCWSEAESDPSSEEEEEEETEGDGRDYSEFIIQKQRESLIEGRFLKRV